MSSPDATSHPTPAGLHFTRIAGETFRAFPAFTLDPHPRRNLIVGANAAGKTSLLEAIYVLGRGATFRGEPADVARSGGVSWKVRGEGGSGDQAIERIEVSWRESRRRIHVDGKPATLHSLVSRWPIEALHASAHRLVEEGPAHRRRYLDWGVFHVEQTFFPAWQRYQRALQQRRRALRAGSPRDEVEAWNGELAQAGALLHAGRERLLPELQEGFERETRSMFGEGAWQLDLERGWAAGSPLEQALAQSYPRDARLGATSVGPHRADLRLTLDAASVRHRISRGQQKLAIAALLLAQARIIARHTGREPVLLIDDAGAELGAPFQEALGRALADYPGQVFATAIEPPRFPAWAEKFVMFHVEHGAVRPGSLI